MSANDISEVSPLAGLTRLTELYLSDNGISEVSPLSGLTGLTNLSLAINELTDVTPLADLTNLTRLDLRGNELTDVTPLAGLTSLTSLALEHNWVVDVAPLAGLTSLTHLYIDRDVDVSPLSDLTGLTVHFMLPPIRYPKLFLLNNLVEAYEDALAAGRVTSAVVPVSGGCPRGISPGVFRTWDPSKPAPSVYVRIEVYTTESVDAVVRFLEDHGISIPPRRIWKNEDAYPPGLLWACVPVPLLVPLSEQPGVGKVGIIVPASYGSPSVIEEESWGTIKNRFK